MWLSLPPLVDVTTLSDHLHDPALRLFDATVELVRPPVGGPYTVQSGRPGYEQAHIPGAAFADIRLRPAERPNTMSSGAKIITQRKAEA